MIIFRQFRAVPQSGKSYSWLETLSPFNSAPKQIYKHLSPENKGSFWSITSSVFIGVLSCWLGFSLQFFVYNSAKTESSKLAHYQVVDKFRPMYMALYDSCSIDVYENIYGIMASSRDERKMKLLPKKFYDKSNIKIDLSNEEAPVLKVFNYISDKSNWSSIDHMTKRCMQISSSIAPYLDSKRSQKLLSNNSLMLIGLQMREAVSSPIVIDSISFENKYAKEFIRCSIIGECSIQSNIFDLYGTAYSWYLVAKGFKETTVGVTQTYLQLTFLPLIENIQIITEEFSPKEVANKPLWISLYILIACLFIGYMMFRIIIMRIFDRNSMTPNPKMSQTDLDNLNRELKMSKKEKEQYEINLGVLSGQIKDLKCEIQRERLNTEKYKKTADNYKNVANAELNKNNALKEEIEKLKTELATLKNDNSNDD